MLNNYQKIQENIEDITHKLNCVNTYNKTSLYMGHAGVLLLKYLQSPTSNSIKLELETSDIVQKICEDDNPSFTYCGGISGTIWLINYLQKKKVISIDDSFYKDIDDYLVIMAHKYLSNSNYDFLHGAGGIILALLDRAEKNKEKLILIVRQLLNIRIEYNGFKIWRFFSGAPENKDKFLISLGLSHGLPSIMMILSKCYTKGILQEECINAITECYKFIRSYENKSFNDEMYSYYPALLTSGEEPSYTARIGWCYGDLSIGIAYYTIGNTIGHGEMVKKGIEIYDYYSGLENVEKFGIVDAQFCHGASGVAHIFNRMYHNTTNEKYRETSQYWTDQAVSMSGDKNDASYYKTWKGAENGWQESPTGLLEGLAGIGVSYSSFLSKEDPDWDECFLLS